MVPRLRPLHLLASWLVAAASVYAAAALVPGVELEGSGAGLVVALIVFGPTRLPELARSLGRAMGEFRRASTDLRQTFNESIQDPKPAPVPPTPVIAPPDPVASADPPTTTAERDPSGTTA